MVCEVLLRVRPIPEGAVEPRGAAFRLRLTSPVHKEPRCPLVCLQKRPSETKKHGGGQKEAFRMRSYSFWKKCNFKRRRTDAVETRGEPPRQEMSVALCS